MNPESPEKNYELAREYHKLGQYAAAVSFYIRAAERSADMDITYNSLILSAICFDEQSRRNFTVEGLLQYAVTVFPMRPEAHFHLCRLYEKKKEWRHLLVHAELGLVAEERKSSDVLNYPGPISFSFYKAFGSYQIGLFEEGKEGFMEIAHLSNDENQLYKTIARNNLNTLGYPDIIAYKPKTMMEKYKFPFPGLETIKKNYSKHFQDMFVLSLLDGKRNGYYLEFGAGYPFFTSNTALLETEFEWKGLSFDKNESFCYDFAENRRNPIIMADALKLDLRQTLAEHCVPSFVDYLQIDCDEASLEILKRIPFDEYQFGIIHFEHDLYQVSLDIKKQSEAILSSKGYTKLVNNVAFNKTDAYEDWWVHPKIYRKQFESMKETNFILEYILDLEL